MRILAGAVALLFLMAGCMGSGGNKFTCEDGSVVDLSTVEGRDVEGFDAQRDACTQLVPPSVVIVDMTPQIEAYHFGNVTWAVINGTAAGGHSMLNVVRFSHHPISEAQMAQLTDPEAYGIVEMGKAEHQNLPAQLSSKFTYVTPGTYYVRAVARIYDDAHNETIYWSPEVEVKVIPVQTTTEVTTITHAPGNAAGEITPSDVTLNLGDGVLFKNDDLTPHTFTFTATPVNGTKNPVTVASMTSSTAIHFTVPGEYTVTTDDAAVPDVSEAPTIRILVKTPTP
jgi:plastocyanin